MHDIWKSSEKSKKSIKIKTIQGEKNGFFNNKNGLKKSYMDEKMAKKAENWKKWRLKIEKIDYCNA